jgi:protocatechuate 3,4-dioxygenase beta subunit
MKSLIIIALATLLASATYGAASGTLSGTVAGPDGSPLKGAFVLAQSATKNKIIITVISDKQGRYRMKNLSPGGYKE